MSVTKNIDSDRDRNIEGYLANRLHSALKFTVEKFVSSLKLSSFKKKYKDIYDINPDDLKSLFDQITSQLQKNIHEDLDKVCEEHSIDMLLTSLEKINEHQHSQIWRPSGNPKDDLIDHIHPLKVKHKEALENVLNKLIVGNEELVNKAAVNHADIMHIKKCNDDLHGEFNNIVSSLNGTNLQNLQTHIKCMMEEK